MIPDHDHARDVSVTTARRRKQHSQRSPRSNGIDVRSRYALMASCSPYVPIGMFYGTVVEYVAMGVEEMQRLLVQLVGSQ
jgi:hypothetical protein